MGSGQVEEMLFKRVPGVRVVGTDFSEPMLALAKARLEVYADRYEVVRQDLREASEARLPEYDYSVAISVQVIHNVAHEYKKEAFGFVYEALMEGGLFLLLDRIRVSTPGLFGAYGSIWGRLNHREGNTFEEHEVSVSRRGDQPATLEEHLVWLREAGFGEVAVLHLYGNRALFAARK
jgi:cyclopropane fatty-acyl-phospholipid synthase-like methyltransferase